MKIKVKHLNSPALTQGIDWLIQNVGPRKYYLHNQTGGDSWRSCFHDGITTIEIDDEKAALMFMLKFGWGK